MSSTEAGEHTHPPDGSTRVALPVCICLTIISIFLSYRVLDTSDDLARKKIAGMRNAFERFIVLNRSRMDANESVDEKQSGAIILNSDGVEANRKNIEEIMNLIMDDPFMKPYLGDQDE